MHQLRNKHKKKGRHILNQQQLAQQRLIEISVMPDNEAQFNEADIFAQKLSPKYASKPQQRSQSAQIRNKTYSSSSDKDTKLNQKYYGSCSFEKKIVGSNPPERLSTNKKVQDTVKMICLSSSQALMGPFRRKFKVQVQSPKKMRCLQQSKQRRHMSFSLFNRIHQKCQSMRSRLKKDLNQEVLSAFHISNIKLKNRFENYIRQFKMLKS